VGDCECECHGLPGPLHARRDTDDLVDALDAAGYQLARKEARP
jgi:hypothetical protein